MNLGSTHQSGRGNFGVVAVFLLFSIILARAQAASLAIGGIGKNETGPDPTELPYTASVSPTAVAIAAAAASVIALFRGIGNATAPPRGRPRPAGRRADKRP